MAPQAARSDEIAAARADSRGAEAELALARWREGQKQRVAPVAAQVQDVMYRVGEWVAGGAPVLALLPPGALKVRFLRARAAAAAGRHRREVLLACDAVRPG